MMRILQIRRGFASRTGSAAEGGITEAVPPPSAGFRAAFAAHRVRFGTCLGLFPNRSADLRAPARRASRFHPDRARSRAETRQFLRLDGAIVRGPSKSGHDVPPQQLLTLFFAQIVLPV